MAIGVTALVLPARVALDSPAWIPGSGAVETQVFGKPLLTFSPSALRKSQPVKSYAITLKALLEEDAKTKRGFDVSSGTAGAPSFATYSRSAKTSYAKPLGSFLNSSSNSTFNSRGSTRTRNGNR